ncbi:hypothetical protein RHDC3_03020 [Rhodocyclaceae bacterium]|nr:hypothetical protein RHDC3_03020 [Rhodocyclaceae bacterium]
MLLEVLVSILIFAIGVLSIVGLQVNSIKQSTAAKYRTDASLLVNEYVSRMWVTNRTFAALNADFSTGGAEYNNWLPSVQALLPGAAANPPTVAIASIPSGVAGGLPSSHVTVTLRWKAPNEPPGDPVHSLTVVTQIK